MSPLKTFEVIVKMSGQWSGAAEAISLTEATHAHASSSMSPAVPRRFVNRFAYVRCAVPWPRPKKGSRTLATSSRRHLRPSTIESNSMILFR